MALLRHDSTIRRYVILHGKKRFVWQLKIAALISRKLATVIPKERNILRDRDVMGDVAI